jgi:hypothetical protein
MVATMTRPGGCTHQAGPVAKPAQSDQMRWNELLRQIVSEPGIIEAAYSAFHDYSLGNQLLAAFQCHTRGLPIGPISTYPGWKAKGRQVKKGEKALQLCMPVTIKSKAVPETDEDTKERGVVKTIFVYRNNWFVLAQTDGPDLELPPIPSWDKERAMSTLNAHEIPFDHPDGNCMGFARSRGIAVSPLAPYPWKTWIHELAHVVMHQGDHADGKDLPRDLKEAEAETVAFLVGEALGIIEDRAACCGYVQHWLQQSGKDVIPEKNAQRILATADQILKAGREEKKAKQEGAA